MLIQTSGRGGGNATSVDCLSPITPSYIIAEDQEEVQRRSSARSQQPPCLSAVSSSAKRRQSPDLPEELTPPTQRGLGSWAAVYGLADIDRHFIQRASNPRLWS